MKAYIYSYWSDQKKTINDLNNPIIISIATLRNKTTDDIFVFDYGNTDWQSYDDMLKVKVIKKQSMKIEGFSEFQNNVYSRNFDILKFSKNSEYETFISVDSDIFWLTSAEKINNEKFNIRCGEKLGFNNGCYCFNKNRNGMIFMEKFTDNLKRSIENKEFRKLIKSKYKFLNDETVTKFTYEQNKELCTENDFLYNGSLFDLDFEFKWILDSGNVHVVHGKLKEKISDPFFYKKCGFIAFLIEEFNISIRDKLPNYYKSICMRNIKVFNFKELVKNGTSSLLEEFYKICKINNKIF